MAKKNQVTLTFAGDTDKLEKAFDRVGDAAKGMGDDTRKAGKSLDDVGESAGDLDQRAMGFRDGITGVQDSMSGWSKLMQGDLQGGLLEVGMGVGDLASSVENLIVPLAKNAAQMVKTGSTWVVQHLKMAGATAASVARQIAAWAVLGGQSLLHAGRVALAWLISMGPIILVVAAVIALVIVIIKNWDTISSVISKGWKFVKRITASLWDGIKRIWHAGVAFVVDTLRKRIATVKGLFRGMISGIRAILGGAAKMIAAPFSSGFRGIRSAWNRTVGGKGFQVPDWVPGVGGKSFKIPRLAAGGILKPKVGGHIVNVSEAGQSEAVIPLDRLGSMLRSAQGGGILELRSDGSKLMDLLLEILREAISVRGGDVQVALGQ